MDEKNNQQQMPDFDQLTDRIIRDASKGPFLRMKTNLDPEDPEAFNPYKDGQLSQPD